MESAHVIEMNRLLDEWIQLVCIEVVLSVLPAGMRRNRKETDAYWDRMEEELD